jgi:muramoyltetrapeptide carboxypeptidase
LTRPPRLTQGATIGVAAVSGPVDPERLRRGVGYLEARGYRVRPASNLSLSTGFLAGRDEERAAGYRELLRAADVQAVFFARGGCGSSRVLPYLDAEEARANPKIHLGGSDLTALFAWLARHAGLAAFYGPMVAVEMASANADLDWGRVLRGEAIASHSFDSTDVLRPGRAEGVLTGGCLSLLASLCGTPEAIRGEGAILFWEDTGEDSYRLDRLLTQLERSGTFDGLQGMVIGSVVPRPDGESREAVRDYLRSRFERARYPVAMGFPAGHLESPRTLPLGGRARLELSDRPELSFGNPVVR